MNSQYVARTFKVTSKADGLVHGLFGQALAWLLESLVELEKLGIHPSETDWHIDTRSYGCVIPGILLPKGNNKTTLTASLMETLSMVKLKQSANEPFDLEESSFKRAHDLLHRWFSIEPSVLARVPDDINERWLGVHYRGTDKQLDHYETDPVSQTDFITLVKDFCEQRKFEGLFVCSDEDGFIAELATAAPDLKISSIDQLRSESSGSLHFDHIPDSSEEKLSMASHALSDVVGLSRCGHIIKCSSALSAWAKILQPNCQLHQVAITRHPWFPVSVVNMYKAHSDSAQEIMRRVQNVG